MASIMTLEGLRAPPALAGFWSDTWNGFVGAADGVTATCQIQKKPALSGVLDPITGHPFAIVLGLVGGAVLAARHRKRKGGLSGHRRRGRR